jgi:hypothetical protein
MTYHEMNYGMVPEQQVTDEMIMSVPGAELIDLIPHLRESCEKVTDGLLEHPDEVRVECVIGPSGSGKTTFAGHKGLWYEDTKENTTSYELQNETGNPNHKIVALHMSLGSCMIEGKRRGAENENKRGGFVVPADKNPLDLTEEQFAAAGLIMQDGIELIRDVFQDDPEHSVVLIVDTVALTSFDTGGVALRKLASDQNVTVVPVLPDPTIETITQVVRNFVAAHPGDPRINELLQQYRIDFGVDLVDAAVANVFVQSSANEFGRINALNDYYNQIKAKAAMGGLRGMKAQPLIQDLTREQFISDAEVRQILYPEFFEARIEDFRLRDERVTTVKNQPLPPEVLEVVHSHFDRVRSSRNVPLWITDNPPKKEEIKHLLLTP